MNAVAVFLLRVAIGVILFGAGAEKVFGWFGGKGLEATIASFQSKMGIPAPLAYLSAFTELLGGLCIALGLLTRPVAFAISINMLVATMEVMPKGFLSAGGAAYPFLVLIVAIAIGLFGPLRYSLDALLFGDTKSA